MKNTNLLILALIFAFGFPCLAQNPYFQQSSVYGSDGKVTIYNMPQGDGTTNLILQFTLGDSIEAQIPITGLALGVGEVERTINGTSYQIFVSDQFASKALFGNRTQANPVPIDSSNQQSDNDTTAPTPSTIAFMGSSSGAISNVRINGWLRWSDTTKHKGVTNTVALPLHYRKDTLGNRTAAFAIEGQINNRTVTVLELKNFSHQVEIRNGRPLLGIGTVLLETSSDGSIKRYRINEKLEKQEIQHR